MFRLRRRPGVLRIGDSVRVALGPVISTPMVLTGIDRNQDGTWRATLETPGEEWGL